MPPGPRPKPTALKVLTGNPGKRALNEDEPTFERLTDIEPPLFLGEIASAEWQRLCSELIGKGVLTEVDTGVLAAYCASYQTFVEANTALAKFAANDPVTRGLLTKTKNGNAVQNPLVGTRNKAALDMVRYASELGITPSSRARISVAGGGASDNPFSAFARS